MVTTLRLAPVNRNGVERVAEFDAGMFVHTIDIYSRQANNTIPTSLAMAYFSLFLLPFCIRFIAGP